MIWTFKIQKPNWQFWGNLRAGAEPRLHSLHACILYKMKSRPSSFSWDWRYGYKVVGKKERVLQDRCTVFWATGATGPTATFAVELASSRDTAASSSVLRTVVDSAAVLSSKRPSVRVAGASSRGRPTPDRTSSKVRPLSRYSFCIGSMFA